ncbi:MAG: DoxX family protein [Polynucleobacter sp.]|nr:DoxX family protein [Polynucleobacter sp.]
MFDFDLSNGYVILRIICGFFMIPNAIAKLRNPAGAIAFFTAAGFPYPHLFVNFTVVFEITVGLALIAGIWTSYAAGLTAVFMLVAALVDFKVYKTWLWTNKGCEYPLFWAICAMVVAFNTI